MAGFLFKIVSKLRREFWQRHYRSLPFEKMGSGVVIDNGVSFLCPERICLGNRVFIGKDSSVQC